MNINFCVEISITEAQFHPCGVYSRAASISKITFFKSLTTVTVNHVEGFKRNLKF